MSIARQKAGLKFLAKHAQSSLPKGGRGASKLRKMVADNIRKDRKHK